MAGSRKPWLTEQFFEKNPLKVKFNPRLTDAERDWFIEIVIVGVYPNLGKIKKFSKILEGWDEHCNMKKKRGEVKNLFFDNWEIEAAYNLMLPEGAKPIRLLSDYEDEKKEAYKHFVFLNYGPLAEREKERMILSYLVESKAIINTHYKIILHAFYIYRSKFNHSAKSPPIPRIIERDAQVFCRLIMKGRNVECMHDLKTEALKKFFKHFQTYVMLASIQQPGEHEALMVAMRSKKTTENLGAYRAGDRDLFLTQTRHPEAYGGKFTPFQYLLFNVCQALSAGSKDALLHFKQHLTHLFHFTHAIINIGIQAKYIVGLLPPRRR